MINVSPIGRNASNDEREEFEKYDKVSGTDYNCRPLLTNNRSTESGRLWSRLSERSSPT